MSKPQRITPNTILRVVLYGPEGDSIQARPVDVAELTAAGYSPNQPAPKAAPSPIPVPAPKGSRG